MPVLDLWANRRRSAEKFGTAAYASSESPAFICSFPDLKAGQMPLSHLRFPPRMRSKGCVI